MKAFFISLYHFLDFRTKIRLRQSRKILDYYVKGGRYSQEEADRMYQVILKQSKRVSN